MTLPHFRCHRSTLLALFVAGTAAAAPPVEEVCLRNDTVEVTVVPSRAHIAGYRFLDGTNVLWTLPDADAYAAKVGQWNNWGGDKAWIWPQADWGLVCGASWPPPRGTEVTEAVPCEGGGRLRLASPPIPGYGVRIVREIALAPTGSTVTVRTRLVPEAGPSDGPDRPFAAWTVTQVSARNDGLYARGLAVDAPWSLLGTGFALPLPRPIRGTRVVRVAPEGHSTGKSGFEGDAFAVRYGNVLFLQRALPFPGASFGPGERAQVYVSPLAAPHFPESAGPYVELEFTAPLARRADVGQQELTVEWHLVRLPEATGDGEVARLLEQLPAE